MPTIHHHLRWAIALLLIVAFLLPAAPVALAQDVATIHYFRPDGDYTDWGLHAWDGAAVAVEWGAPLPPTGEDDFGVYWEVPIKPDAARLGLIVHKGEEKDPGPDLFLEMTQASLNWVKSRNISGPGSFSSPLWTIKPRRAASGLIGTSQ